jgi:hypothetical protein
MLLLLLLQHSANMLILSGLSRYVSKITGLVAGRLTALRILISLTATLCSARDRLGDRSCGGLGGGGVRSWLDHLQSRSYLSLLSSLVRALLLLAYRYQPCHAAGACVDTGAV